MLVVDPFHWLEEGGHLPRENLRLRRQALRVARLIEYGGPLKLTESRETLVECSKRVDRRPCAGLMWVTKTNRDEIYAYCIACGKDEVLIHNWQDTEWADGPMEPVAPLPENESSAGAVRTTH